MADSTSSVAHEVVRRLIKHLDNDSGTDQAPGTLTAPASIYADPARWERDRKLLRTTPTVVALSTELREPGSFKTADLGGLPVIVVRGADGAARVLINRCSHRGTELVQGRGQKRRFTCPFHGWSFEPTGQLGNVTSDENFCDLDRSKFGLTSLPVREELGLIWAAGLPDVPLAEADLLTGMEEDVRQLDLDRWHFQYAEALPAGVNWRMLLEGVSETYHLPYLHAKTAARIFYSNVMTFDAFGRHFRMAWPRRTIDEVRGVPEPAWVDPIRHVNLLYYIFPNTIVLYNAGMWQALPGTSPSESTMLFNFFTIGDDPAMTQAQQQRFQFAIDVTREEDNPAAEASMRNFAAQPDRPVVFGRNEICLQHLYRHLDEPTSA
jgi:phenylpropionate dioxygenase-like ring-hydroxylating dioxygenase large terminal subunit